MTPEELVAEARRMLDECTPGTVSSWSRASALLCRQALEAALSALWVARAPDVRWVSMRAQLICLHGYVPAVAGEVAYTWNALSRATHHHPYELDATREELGSLIEATIRAIAALRG